MSTRTTCQDAAGTASTQVSLGEVLSDFDAEEPAEEPDDETSEVDPTVDLSIKVGVGEGWDHYHVIFVVNGTVISKCPHHDLEIVALEEVVEKKCKPCRVCNPTDWRLDEDATEEEA